MRRQALAGILEAPCSRNGKGLTVTQSAGRRQLPQRLHRWHWLGHTCVATEQAESPTKQPVQELVQSWPVERQFLFGDFWSKFPTDRRPVSFPNFGRFSCARAQETRESQSRAAAHRVVAPIRSERETANEATGSQDALPAETAARLAQ